MIKLRLWHLIAIVFVQPHLLCFIGLEATTLTVIDWPLTCVSWQSYRTIDMSVIVHLPMISCHVHKTCPAQSRVVSKLPQWSMAIDSDTHTYLFVSLTQTDRQTDRQTFTPPWRLAHVGLDFFGLCVHTTLAPKVSGWRLKHVKQVIS